MSKLLQSAIADAKAVRETALQNAKAVLEEAFDSKLKGMLSTKLQQEIYDEEEGLDDLEEFNALQNTGLDTQHGETADMHDVPSKIYETEVPVNSSNTDKSDVGPGRQVKASDQDTNQTPDNDTSSEGPKVGGNLTPSNTDKSDVGPGRQVKASDQDTNQTPDNDTSSELHLEGEEYDDSDDELNEIISELEAELGADDEFETEEEFGMDDIEGEGEFDVNPESDIDSEDEFGDDEEIGIDIEDDDVEGEEMPADDAVAVAGDDEDEEIDLDEILREMELGDDESSCDIADEELMKEVSALRRENNEYKRALGIVRGKLHEVNLLNSKLLFTNKVFKSIALNNNQKMKVVEAFDRASNVREVKLTYANLCESFRMVNGNKKKSSITESASRAVKSTAPSKKTIQKQKEVLSEGADHVARFQKLANIIK